MRRYVRYNNLTGIVSQDSETSGVLPIAPAGETILDVTGRPELTLSGMTYANGVFTVTPKALAIPKVKTRSYPFDKSSADWTSRELADAAKMNNDLLNEILTKLKGE